ncbi:MAG: hypothetical protein VCA36_09940, partial [Opitutales bacterium]
ADFLLERSGSDGLSSAMAGFRLTDVVSEHGVVARGICKVEDGLLQSVEETTSIQRNGTGFQGLSTTGKSIYLSGQETASMNIWAFPRSFFSELEQDMRAFAENANDLGSKEFYLPSAVDAMIRAGRGTTRTFQVQGPWMGITYREDRPLVVRKLRELVASGVYPERLWG